MRVRLPRFVAAALLILGIAAAPALPARAEEVTVQASVTGFSPSSLNIKTGTTVTWKNSDLFEYPAVRGTHVLTANDGSFTSDEIGPGASYTVTFNKPGTIAYRCKIHPTTMTGQLVVTGPEIKPPATERDVKIVEPNPNNPQSWKFDPVDITVDTGTTITWRNNGSQAHTVTSDDDAFDSGDLAGGGTYKRTFDKPGVLRYHCKPHPWMTGVIRVAAPGQAPPVEEARAASGGSGSPAPKAKAVPTGARGPITIEAFVVEPSASEPFSWGFDPSSIKAQTGDTVLWKNAGKSTHTITADDASFDSGNVAAGGTFSLKLDKAGVIRYHCTPHPWMKGVIAIGTPTSPAVAVVAPPSAASVGGGGGSSEALDVSAGTGTPRESAGRTGREEFPTSAVALITVLGVALPAAFFFATGWRPATAPADLAGAIAAQDDDFGVLDDDTRLVHVAEGPPFSALDEDEAADDERLVGAGRLIPH